MAHTVIVTANTIWLRYKTNSHTCPQIFAHSIKSFLFQYNPNQFHSTPLSSLFHINPFYTLFPLYSTPLHSIPPIHGFHLRHPPLYFMSLYSTGLPSLQAHATHFPFNSIPHQFILQHSFPLYSTPFHVSTPTLTVYGGFHFLYRPLYFMPLGFFSFKSTTFHSIPFHTNHQLHITKFHSITNYSFPLQTPFTPPLSSN